MEWQGVLAKDGMQGGGNVVCCRGVQRSNPLELAGFSIRILQLTPAQALKHSQQVSMSGRGKGGKGLGKGGAKRHRKVLRCCPTDLRS